MENLSPSPDRRPDEARKKPPSGNMQPLLEMLDMLEPRPETLFEKIQAWCEHLVPHVFGVIRTLVGKVIIGLAAAAIAGGILKQFAHRKPDVPAPQRLPAAHPEHAHAPVVHKHIAVHHPIHKKHKKHSTKTKKHKPFSSSQANS